MTPVKSEKSSGARGYVKVLPPANQTPGSRAVGSKGSGQTARTPSTEGRGSFSGSPSNGGAGCDWGSPHKTSRRASVSRGA